MYLHRTTNTKIYNMPISKSEHPTCITFIRFTTTLYTPN